MGTFDDAASRRVGEMQQASDDAARRQAMHGSTVARARQQAEDELTRLLRDMADFLARNARPVSVQTHPRWKWNKPATWSPTGFVIDITTAESSPRVKKLRYVKSMTLLLPDGRLWRKEPSSVGLREDVTDIRFDGTYPDQTSSRIQIGDIAFYADLTTGALLAQKGSTLHENLRQVEPTDELADLAARIVRNGIGVGNQEEIRQLPRK